MTTYDLIVIGTGSGGLSIGLSMHALGFKVLLVEKEEANIGGECLNTGCVPSKALIHVAEIIHSARLAGQFGWQPTGKTDFEKVKEYIRERQGQIRSHENADFFRKQGLDVIIGTARFADKSSVEVNGQRFTAKKMVIATGSRPRRLQVPGVEKVLYYDNQNIFDISFLPEKLLIVGGGPIGLEMAQAFSRLGSQVTVVHSGERILEKEAPEISLILQQRLEIEGIRFMLNSRLTSFPGSRTARIENPDNTNTQLNFDAVLVGIGREVYLEGLGLDRAGIETKDGKLTLNDYLQTTNPRVYTIGDAAGGPYFSHAAEWQATVMVGNFLSPFKKKIHYDHFSWVTFTDPEVATFGLNEGQLQRRRIAYEKIEYNFSEDDRAVTDEYTYGKLILYVRKNAFNPQKLKLLGGTMIAPNAGEMSQELILANSAGLTLKAIFDKTYPYPTASRVNKLLVVNQYTQSIKPWMKKLLKWLY